MKSRRVFWVGLLFSILIFAQLSFAQAPKPVVYVGVGGTNPTKVGWDYDFVAEPLVDRFKLTMIRDVSNQEFNYGIGKVTQFVLPRPRSGTYVIEVRAGKVGSDDVLRYSEPCVSINATCARLKDGTPGAWKVQWKPSGPVGPIIIIPKETPK